MRMDRAKYKIQYTPYDSRQDNYLEHVLIKYVDFLLDSMKKNLYLVNSTEKKDTKLLMYIHLNWTDMKISYGSHIRNSGLNLKKKQ